MPVGMTPPDPQPDIVAKAARAIRMIRLPARRRRGSVRKSRPARVAVLPFGNQRGVRVLDAWSPEADDKMVSVVVAGLVPLSWSVGEVKRQDEPEGTPPVQVKVMVELKPPEGVAVKVTALEVLPRAMVVVDVEGESVKVPTAWITWKTIAVDEAEAWALSPE